MKIEQIDEAIRLRWTELKRNWNGKFNTMKLPLLQNEKIQIGIDLEKRPCAIIIMPNNSTSINQVQISSGLFISVQRKTIEGDEKTVFVVTIDNDSEIVYSAFVADFLLNVNLDNPRNSFDEVYRTWKKKWAASRTPLGPREVEGLVGEIAVFMQLLEHMDDTEKLVDAWVGPLKSLHDFESNSIHLEVKTTTRDPPVIRVSKLDQLAPRDNGRFDLIIVHLEVIDGGSTLPMIVNRMLANEKVKPHLESILERLDKVGYSEKHSLHYNRGFNIVNYTSCPINDETPILSLDLLSDIPATVSEIRYNLNIKGLKRSSITMNMWENMAELISKNSIDSDEIVSSSNDDIDVVKLPESATLERKETIWFEAKREGQKDYTPQKPGMVSEVIRAIAAMLNSDGGIVLVGIHDNGEIIGLARDRKICKNYDNLELWLTREIQDSFGHVISATCISLRLIELNSLGLESNEMICRIDVMASPNPVIASVPENKSKNRVQRFFMRDGNGTQVYDMKDAIEIIRRKWP